ncbi:MAG: 23S rRNA (uracil(1939)-C(5))-methyltransferase RlmD [Endomicrobium sp.]|jgi:23S rRNA (uracil-5-)-methyltransferase RumA|nr:23S rRNA (uracil(1939)-C(5))-methyltransferase RlmD [Endomicrobium sp.]
MSLKNKIIRVKSEKIVFPGRSLCRCDDGIALFTEGLLPDESADVIVTKDKKTFREGLLKNITSKSYERIDPLCPSFNLCGGCSFQNVSYENQIKYKQKYIAELLDFTGVKISNILKSPRFWHYRNKMEFSFFNNKGIADLGLHCKGSFDRYVSIPPCFIADKDFSQPVKLVKRFANDNNLTAHDNKTHEGFFRHLVLRKAANNNQLLVNIVTSAVDYETSFLEPLIKELKKFSDSIYWTFNSRKSDAVSADSLKLMHGQSFITERLSISRKNYFFNISPFSFFQTSSKGTEILYNEVLRLLNPSKEDVLLDLYCGTGTIAVSIAQNVKKVIGIDLLGQAIDNAKENACINDIYNVEFSTSNAQDWVKENENSFNIIVLDPPRGGVAKNVVKFLIDSKAEKIVYISCNPSTLARDLKLITESGKYKVKEITPVDMFPQTYHIETLVLLEL